VGYLKYTQTLASGGDNSALVQKPAVLRGNLVELRSTLTFGVASATPYTVAMYVPKGSLIVGAYAHVTTGFTAAAEEVPTMAVQTHGATGNLIANTVLTLAALVDDAVLGGIALAVKVKADVVIDFTVETNDFTAGVAELVVIYSPCDPS